MSVYTVGFVLPFFAVGLATSAVLQFFRTHGSLVRYTVKIGGVLLIVMGILTATGWMNGVTGYLSSFGSTPAAQEQSASAATEDETAADSAARKNDGASASSGSARTGEGDGSSSSDPSSATPAPLADLQLVDQNGAAHALSDYRGKTIFLNFFATWCGPCQREIPDIEALYRDWGENTGDLVVLGVANPRDDANPSAADVSEPELKEFIADEGITYPVLMDFEGSLFSAYGVSAFPTTFMIAADGTVFGYVPGMLTADVMDRIVEQAMQG